MSDITAFVLAGGRSTRMGTDKALLPFAGLTLLERALRTASAVAASTVIVGAAEKYAAFGKVVEDVYTGCGPLGGIHAALSTTQTAWNLILSVDLPRMTSEFLEWLAREAYAAKELIVVPNALGGLQPLCAIYKRNVLAAVEQALNNGDYKIGHLFSVVPTRQIAEGEIISAGFSAEVFRNINTAADYQALGETIAGSTREE